MAGQGAQDFIDAIVALAAAAANNIAPAVANPFALLPGAANRNALDYMNRADMALFTRAIEPLDTKFDMKEEQMRVFLEGVRKRAIRAVYCWDDLLTVPDGLAPPVGRDLISSFGVVSLENCQTHAAGHVVAASRMSQDSMMLYLFLLDSLTERAKLLVITEKESYTVSNKPSGVCLLKVIIGRSSIDTNAKVAMLRKKIARLGDHMKDLKGDFREFNVYVAEQRDQLIGRGQPVGELITLVFEAYKQVPDDEFQRYIETFQNQYDENVPVNVNDLMSKALTKYDTINQRKEVSSEGDNRILALTAEPSGSVQQQILEAIQSLQANAATFKKDGDGKKGANAKRTPTPEWKMVPPGDKDPKSKTVKVKNKDKLFHWCHHHSMWTIHKPDECTFRKEQDKNNPHHNCKAPEDAKTEPKMLLSKALMTI